MIEKLREHPDKIPCPNRDTVMKMCKVFFAGTLAKVDVSDALKRYGLTIKLDGSEDHLVSNKLKALVWDKIKEFRSQLLSKPH